MYKYVPGYRYMYLDVVDHTFPRTQPENLFHIYFYFFANLLEEWCFQNIQFQPIPFRLYLLEIYNTRFGWFDLKFVKHARWIFANMHLSAHGDLIL